MYVSLPPCFKGAISSLLPNLTMLRQLLSKSDPKTWTSCVPLTKFLSTFLVIILYYQTYEPEHHLVVTENDNSENKRLVMCFLNQRWLFQYLNTIRDYYSHKQKYSWLNKEHVKHSLLFCPPSPLVIIITPAVKKFINPHNGKVCLYYKEAP
jgi:hypothetical protein